MEQETHLQMDALRRAGAERIVQEKTSSVGRRPQLQILLESLKPGDRLLVYRLDRLARSLKDLLHILDRLERAHAGFASLSEPIDTATAAGRLMLQMLGAVAEFERTLIRERSVAGQVSSIERGVQWGRPRRLTSEQEAQLLALLMKGVSMSECARRFAVSMAVVVRVRNEARGQMRERCPVLRRYTEAVPARR